jgi:hypothetical protein
MAAETRKLQVIARIRPESSDVSDEGKVASSLRVEGNNKIFIQDSSHSSQYEYDRVYDAKSSTTQLYKESIEQTIANKFYTGNNYVVIAYGSTGAGKTHTLYGDKNESEGIVHKAVETIFNKLEANKMNQKYILTMSVYQLNGTAILDLLNPQPKIQYVPTAHRYLRTVIEGLAQIEINNVEQCLTYIKQSIQVKQQLDLRNINTQQGGANKSHIFIDFNLEIIEKDNASVIKSSLLRFALLAGSGGANLKFNPGLQSFNKVIDFLSADKDSSLINFNQNPLTQLLEVGLGGGNSITSIILFLNPALEGGSAVQATLSDCIHTLELGEKCRKIKNSTKINKNPLNANIRELREEIKKLRGKLNLAQPGQYLHDLNPNDIKQLKNLNGQLELLKQQTWEKKREKSRLFVEKRKENLESEGLSALMQEEVNIPENILNQSKNLLNNVVQAKLAIEETLFELTEARHKYKEITENQGNNSENINLGHLSAAINELDERYRSQQQEVDSIQEEYKKILHKISTIEARQRKIFTINKDYNQLDALNKRNEFSEMKKEIDNDSNYIQAIQLLNNNTENTQNIIRQRFAESNPSDSDANLTELRDETVKLIEDLRVQSEYNKRLEFERDLLWAKLIENQYKNNVEFNRYQEHLYFIFKNYRQHYQEQKISVENKYRELLDNAVKDALKLAEENNKLKLQLENRHKHL